MESNTIAEDEGTPPSIHNHIPIEVIEGILSRLPVKSLIRFQSACKLWHSIISDPRFRQIHCDMMRHNDLFWVRPLRSFHSDRLVKVDYEEAKTEWLLESPFDASVIPTRTCNGTVLMVDDRTRDLGLWNPSIRKHYCWIRTPPEHRDDVRTYAFYYDPIIDDYRIVVVSREYYTIYSCKSASWSETKPYPSSMPARLRPQKGFYVNGSSSFYWLDEELGEIVCFDFRYEKLSRLPLPDLAAYRFCLTARSGRLCVLGQKHERLGLVMYGLWLMENGDRSWRELIKIEKGALPGHLAKPYVLTNEDTAVLSLEIAKTRCLAHEFIIYNLRDKRIKELEVDDGIAINYMFPYSESFNFPIPDIILQRKRKQGTEPDSVE